MYLIRDNDTYIIINIAHYSIPYPETKETKVFCGSRGS